MRAALALALPLALAAPHAHATTLEFLAGPLNLLTSCPPGQC